MSLCDAWHHQLPWQHRLLVVYPAIFLKPYVISYHTLYIVWKNMGICIKRILF